MSHSNREAQLSFIDESIDSLIHLLVSRREAAYLQSSKDSRFRSIFRVGKYLFSQMGVSGPDSNNAAVSAHVSVDAFISDVAKLPDTTKKWSSLKITPRQFVVVLSCIWALYRKIAMNGQKDFQLWSEVAIGYIFYAGIRANVQREVTLHYFSYLPEMFVASFFCSKQPEINCIFYMHMKFIDPTSSIVCNVLVNENEISHEYCLKNRHIYQADTYKFQVSRQDMFKSRPLVPISDKRQVIGLYSSGFYARTSRSYFKEDCLDRWIATEVRVIEFLSRFVRLNPQYKLKIFPHYARGVETEAGAAVFYERFLSDDLIEVAGISSKRQPHESVNLGVTTESNVFWDRMPCGHKTILIDSDICKKFVDDTSLRAFALSTQTNETKSFSDLDVFINMDFESFITRSC